MSNPTEIAINATNFPDENFRNYLLQQSYGQDGVLTEEEISGVTSIHVSLKNISSLKGIEHFTALTYLDCYENQLTALDVSKNTALTWLSCSNNQLTALDVSKNTALTHLECSYNRLTALDVSKNTALTWLECSNNQLTALDVSKNTALERLFCSKNQLTALDVSNTALTSLQCYSNQLTALDVSKNTALTDLVCYENQLTALDVSKNTALKYLYCNNNQLTALDVSKNTALTKLYCYNNQLTALDVSKNTALKQLSCYNNQLTALDVSKNTALKYLYCNNNQLTALDVSKNTALTYLDCNVNQISGASMDNLISSLPTYETENGGTIVIVSLSDANEGNVCTKSQVAAIKAKGWKPYNMNGNFYFEYEGSEDNQPALTEIAINATNFPDANFRNYLLQQSYGQDGVLTEEEIQGVTYINVSFKNISSLKGIEHFTALNELSCGVNQLTELDVSKNTALTSLDCENNQLTALDVSKNTALTELDCGSNQLTALDVSKNTALTELYCYRNQLTALDVSKNTALTGLHCHSNQLTTLDVSKNTALTKLSCCHNQLTLLDVSKNTALTTLYCYSNQLTALDVSKNTALTELECYNNRISGAGMDNLINSLRTMPNNVNGTIYIIDVSNPNEGNVCTKSQVAAIKAKGWTPKSYDGSNYAEYEGSEGITISINATNFPDENFRNYLLQQSYGQDGVLTEEEIQGITSIIVTSRKISSLKGIEHFTALTELVCLSNQLTALDVSKNTALTLLYCYGNQLTALDVSKNTALTSLDCNHNQLTALDVSKNTALTSLYCYINKLTALDVSKNTALTWLDCENNQLTALDVSKNTALTELYCSNNQLTALDVSKNTALTKLYCSNNQLTALDVSKNTALTELYCPENQLTALDMSKNTALSLLHCYSNKIYGASMDGLINSLPVTSGIIDVVNLSDVSEGNVCTKSQVAAIKAKGWKPMSYDGSNYAEYEGSDEEVDPLVFADVSTNGVPMTFKITDEQAKTCQIGDGVNPAISTGQTGKVVLPITANGYSVTAIADNAFAGTNIGTVHVPNNIKAVGDRAFANCTMLDHVYSYFEEPFDIPTNVFSGISSSATLEIVYGTKDKYLAATGWNKFAKYYESMYFIDGIRYGVEGANPVEVNGNAYTAWVKESYWNLYTGDVVIPETFAIGDETFTVVGIDDNAFDGSAIRSVTIPRTVRSIDGRAFADCQQLQTVTSYIMEPKDESSAFLNIPSSATLYVPAGTKALYESLGGWNLFTNIVEMEEEVEPTDISQMDNVIYIEPTEGLRGSIIELRVKMKNVLTPVGCSFRLTLPEGMRLLKDGDGDVVYELGSRARKMSLTMMDRNDGSYDFALTPTSATATITGTDDTFITFHMQLPDDLTAGDYKLRLTRCLIQSKTDGTTRDNALSDVTTTLSVEDYLMGDVNGDGSVTPADAIMTLYHYFGSPQTGFNAKAADVNADGSVTPADAIETLYMYFGGTANAKRQALTTEHEPQ